MLKAFKQQLGHHFCDMKFNPMHNAAKLDLTLYRISKSDNWKGHTTIWCYLSNMTKTAFVLTSKFVSFILEYMLRTFDFLSSTCQYSKHITIWHCSQVKLHPVLWLVCWTGTGCKDNQLLSNIAQLIEAYLKPTCFDKKAKQYLPSQSASTNLVLKSFVTLKNPAFFRSIFWT